MFLRLMSISWRSIWRNGRRTVITGLAIGLGLASMLFTDALMQGMGSHMIQVATDSWMGQGQIHRNGFLETKKLELTINAAAGLLEQLAQDTTVAGFTPRIISPASLSSARELKPVNLYGVDLSTDTTVTMLNSALVQGQYFSGDSMEIVLGDELARDLKARMGDIIVITVAQLDGGLASSMYSVSGICRFGTQDLDRYAVFINAGSADALLNLQGRIHEIAVRFHDIETGTDSTGAFQQTYTAGGNRALGWPQLAPQVDSMKGMIKISMAIMAFILFGMVIFGIINSLFMSVYERMFEFAIMKAVGTRPGSVASMVVLEAFWLGVFSTCIGLLMGLATLLITSKTGISFGEIEFSGIVFDRPIYPVISMSSMFVYSLFTIFLTAAAGIFPGIHAARLNPSESMRRSM